MAAVRVLLTVPVPTRAGSRLVLRFLLLLRVGPAYIGLAPPLTAGAVLENGSSPYDAERGGLAQQPLPSVLDVRRYKRALGSTDGPRLCLLPLVAKKERRDGFVVVSSKPRSGPVGPSALAPLSSFLLILPSRAVYRPFTLAKLKHVGSGPTSITLRIVLGPVFTVQRIMYLGWRVGPSVLNCIYKRRPRLSLGRSVRGMVAPTGVVSLPPPFPPAVITGPTLSVALSSFLGASK